MDPRAQIAEAHAVGRAVTVGGIEQVRAQALVQVRRSMGMTREPPAPCLDPDLAYIAPDSVVRRVHGDLPAMLIGGLSALLFQMLHPLAMAGVAQHSNYRSDPLGRLERTASFLGTTTFGTVDEARVAIDHVRGVHGHVRGVASDGRPYAATDPDLLTWVHAAEVSSFLAAAGSTPRRRRRRRRPTSTWTGWPGWPATWVPSTCPGRRELGALGVGPAAAHFTPEARDARNFLLRGVGRWPHEVATYGLWSGRPGRPALLGPSRAAPAALPDSNLLAVRPSARCSGPPSAGSSAPPHPSRRRPGANRGRRPSAPRRRYVRSVDGTEGRALPSSPPSSAAARPAVRTRPGDVAGRCSPARVRTSSKPCRRQWTGAPAGHRRPST